MKTKMLLAKLLLIVLSVSVIFGVVFTSLHFRVQGDLFRNAYSEKQKILESNRTFYTQNVSNIKSIERNIPIFSSPELLVTSISYDRVILDSGKSFIVKHKECKLFDNGQKVNIVQNNNKKREAYIFPEQTTPTLKSLFMIGNAYQNYLNENQIIIDCSAIPYDKD